MNDHTPAELVQQAIQHLSPEHREDFEERAAIMEFGGALSRDHAEALALLDLLLRSPEALLRIDLYAITRKGQTRYLLSQRDQLSADRLKAIGYDVSTPFGLRALLQAEFDGMAMLVRPRPEQD